MRFMIILKSDAETEAGAMPAPDVFEAMGRYNESLIEAGIMLAGEGLHPSSAGARLKYEGGKPTVTDGPFSEAKELIAGFWILQVKDKAEAIEWARRIPLGEGAEVEIRRVFEAADFSGIVPDEEIEKEQAWRDANQKPVTG